MSQQPPLPSSLPVVALLGVVSGCSVLGGLPRGALTPVDCSDLPHAPDDMVSAIERSEAALTDADLEPGEAWVAFGLSDDSGAQWYLSPKRDDAEVLYRDDHYATQGLRWSLRVKLACSPEAAAFVNFAREDGTGAPLTPGAYPLIASGGFDVPDAEQGNEAAGYEVEGTVTLTSAADDSGGITRISGYMVGFGHGVISSYLTQELIGPDVTIGAAAFRDVPVY